MSCRLGLNCEAAEQSTSTPIAPSPRLPPKLWPSSNDVATLENVAVASLHPPAGRDDDEQTESRLSEEAVRDGAVSEAATPPQADHAPSPGRELRKDLLRYLPAQGIPALISIITIPILTRLFAPDAYGDYRLVLATVGVFGSAAAWLPSSIYRFFPELELAKETGRFFATLRRLTWVTVVVFSSLWLVGLVALRPSINETLFKLFAIGMFLMIVNTSWAVASGLSRALRQVGWYSFAVSANKALTLGLGLALVIRFGLGVDGLLYGSIVGSLVLIPFLTAAALRAAPKQAGRYDGRLAREMLRYGYPIALMMMASWLLQLSDRYVIAALRDTREVGLYSAAYALAEQGMQLILVIFQLPFAVLGSRVWESKGEDAAAEFVSNSCRSYLLLAVPAWLGLSVLAQPLMNVMTENAYREAAVIMPMVGAALLLGGIQWWYTSGSTFTKRTTQQLVSILVGLGVNLGLNIALVGRFGYRIAAFTTLVGYFAAMMAMAFQTRRYFRWRFPVAGTVRALGASVAMALVLLPIIDAFPRSSAMQLGVGIPLGVLVYGLMLVALREPTATMIARRLLRRPPSG
jgi:O-antigen/teichoic acid export membrane protein